MEKEINTILETINEGLKSLPPLAGEAFEVMVKGTRINGVIGLFESVVFLISAYIVLTKLYRLSKDESIYNSYGEVKGHYVLVFIVIGGGFGFLGIVALFTLTGNIVDIFAPEYSLIKSIMRGIN